MDGAAGPLDRSFEGISRCSKLLAHGPNAVLHCAIGGAGRRAAAIEIDRWTRAANRPQIPLAIVIWPRMVECRLSSHCLLSFGARSVWRRAHDEDD